MKYSRDKRSPKPKNEKASKLMSKIKSKNTKPELILRKALYEKGIRGYRIHKKGIPGRPDIAWIGKRVAIFVNGCFWHSCPKCNLQKPKHNSEFWNNKFKTNKLRDSRKIMDLTNAGWKVLTIWECDIKNDIESCIIAVRKIRDID
jgi:DNA mismatch endonuclease (patch repair protein)